MADSTTYASRLTGEETLEEMLKRHRQDGVQCWTERWDEATKMQRFSNGEQWPDQDSKAMEKRKAAHLTIDEIGPVLQAFAGRQMMQRFERAYMPRHSSAARQGEVMTAVDRAFMFACDAEQVDSAAFKDGPGVQGISVTRWELDTLNERGGGLLYTDWPIWQAMADPEARKVNLSDRSWHRLGSWWAQGEVKSRWPDKWPEIVGSLGGRSWVGADSGESSRIPWAGMAGNKPFEPYFPRGRALWIEYEEWRSVERHWRVGHPVDPSMTYAQAQALAEEGGEGTPDTFTETRMDTQQQVREFKEQHLAVHGEEVPKEFIVPKEELVYRYAYICGDHVLETDLIPTGYWTIQFLTGYRFPLPNKVSWRSLVSRLVDAQRWINVMLSALIRNIQINPKGLLFVEEGFFKNWNEAADNWAKPGGLIRVARGKLSAGQKGYEHLSAGSSPYHQMVQEMMAFYREAIPRLAGFNPAALGQLGGDLRRISGEVVRQLQDAVMTANAEPFDALRLHRRDGGRIFLSFLKRFFEVEDLIRIVGEEVAYEPVMEPALNPMTGQPEPDPITGGIIMKPATDPATGQPARRLVLPPREAWAADYWKEISTEDVMSSGDQLQVLWKSLETSIQILLQPQPDTGLPLFTSDILTEIVPGIPAQIREKMRQYIKAAKAQRQQQMWAQQQAPPEGGQPNGQGGEEQAAA